MLGCILVVVCVVLGNLILMVYYIVDLILHFLRDVTDYIVKMKKGQKFIFYPILVWKP